MNVALRCVLVLAEHRPDSMGQLSLVRLIDAACVDPKVLQPILLCLLSAEANSLVASLVLAVASYKVR
jgi:hypothetical protein